MGHLFLSVDWTETRKHMAPAIGSHTMTRRAPRLRMKLNCGQQSAEPEGIQVLLGIVKLLSMNQP